MSGSSNTSFIPKRSPSHNERQNTTRQVFLGSFIIKILFFASLLASVGVFAYETKLKKNLDSEIINLNNAISSFNEAEMERILKVDQRLSQANQRLLYSASISSLLKAIEESTANSSQINNLVIKRTNDEVFEVESEIETGTFDAVLFQREILENSKVLGFGEIKDLTFDNVPPDNALYDAAELSALDDEKVTLSFKAFMTVATEQIPHLAAPAPTDIFKTETATTTQSEEAVAEEVVVTESNQADI